ncbi:MAG: prolyl oligopeptidase family serine peptidase [Thermomicrobiales bacterium]
MRRLRSRGLTVTGWGSGRLVRRFHDQLGHAHTGRFRAAVTQRTISDWFFRLGADDIFFADGNVTFGSTPLENPELYLSSRRYHVDQMETPLLIIPPEEDYRCPISQSEELFTALMRLGRETEFLRIPDEESRSLANRQAGTSRCPAGAHFALVRFALVR